MRRHKLNESVVILTIPCGLTNADADFRFLSPGDGVKVKSWKLARSRAGTGTAIIAMAIYSAAGATGTQITANQSNDIDAAVGTITAGADAVADFTFAEGAPIFVNLNYDAGTVTAECVVTATLILQY